MKYSYQVVELLVVGADTRRDANSPAILLEFTKNLLAEFKFFILNFASSSMSSIILPNLCEVQTVFVMFKIAQNSTDFPQLEL